MARSPPNDRQLWKALLKEGFGLSFWLFLGFAVVMGVTCYLIDGPAAFFGAASQDAELLANMLPRVIGALALAGFIWMLLPRDRFSKLIGSSSGLRGLVIAAVAGIITPGGPTSAYPLLAMMGGAGADRGALVSYITAWALLGLQRLLIWDLPFMGPRFALTRFLVCLPLPILAGLIARRLPLQLRLVSDSSQTEERR